jgi:hypothetical protein
VAEIAHVAYQDELQTQLSVHRTSPSAEFVKVDLEHEVNAVELMSKNGGGVMNVTPCVTDEMILELSADPIVLFENVVF